MKTFIFSFIFLFCALFQNAQVPAGFSYQAVVRNNSGEAVTNQTVKFRFTIIQNSATGTPVFVEIQSVPTNNFGLANLVVGSGTKVSGNFDPSGWGNNSHFLKVELDPNNGNTFSHLGTMQLMAVPYAFHAQTVEELADNSVTSEKIASGAVTGEKIAQVGATYGQALKWNGTLWAPANDETGVDASWISQDSKLYYNSGNVGIGIDAPQAQLHVNGIDIGRGNVVFSGKLKEGGLVGPPVSGAGTRLMWHPDRGAFRVGQVTGNQWDEQNIGSMSFAMGFNAIASNYYTTAIGHTTTASGSGAIAMGHGTTASGSHATAIGYETSASKNFASAIGYKANASGQNSFSIGFNTNASGDHSTALGFYTNASNYCSIAIGSSAIASGRSSYAFGTSANAAGDYSMAMGYGTVAASAYETVIGYRNIDDEPLSYGQWSPEDRLFVVGNGYHSPGNALTVLKNGNMGIGISRPRQQLSVGAFLDLYSGFANNPSRPSIRASSNNNLIINASGTGILYFNLDGGTGETRFYAGPGGAEILRINSDGRIGIGTGAPTQKLHIVGDAYKTVGGNTWASSSDLRLKTVLGDYEKGLNEIAALHPVRFRYLKNNPRELSYDIEQVGFVAQEVQKIFPEAVSEAEDGYLDFNIHAINIALVNAVKELKTENDRLKAESGELNSRIERLESLISVGAQK